MKRAVSQVKIIDTAKPLPVVLDKKTSDKITSKVKLPKTLPPNTTHEENIVSAGQRRVNLIWEFTQAIVAISITWAVIYCSIKNVGSEVLTNAFFLIVSMYFVRTNHQLIGGVGAKPANQQR